MLIHIPDLSKHVIDLSLVSGMNLSWYGRCVIDQLEFRICRNKQTNTVEVICPFWGVARPISAPPLILYPPTSFSLWQACAFLCAHTSLQLHSFC